LATPFFLYYSRFSIFYAMKNNVELEMKTSTVEPSINLFPQHYDHQFLYHGPIARCPVDHHLTGHIHVFSVLWIGFTSLLEYVLSFLLELFSKDSHPIPQILLSSSLLALTMILAHDTYKFPNRKMGKSILPLSNIHGRDLHIGVVLDIFNSEHLYRKWLSHYQYSYIE